jgi:hypothetical protein
MPRRSPFDGSNWSLTPDPFIGVPRERPHDDPFGSPIDALFEGGGSRNRDRWDLGIDWAPEDEWGAGGSIGLGIMPKGGNDVDWGSGEWLPDAGNPFTSSERALVSEESGSSAGLLALAAQALKKLGDGWVEVGTGSNGGVMVTVHDGNKDSAASQAVPGHVGVGLAVGVSGATGNIYIETYGVSPDGSGWKSTQDTGIKPTFGTLARLGGPGGRVPLKTPDPMADVPLRGPMPSWARKQARELRFRTPRSDTPDWGQGGAARSAGHISWSDLNLLVGGGFTDPSPLDERVARRPGRSHNVPRTRRRGPSDDPGDFGPNG